MKTPLIVCGAFGRMGRSVIELALKNEQFLIAAGVARPGSLENRPQDWLFPIYHDLESALLKDMCRPVIIDFSVAACASYHLSMAKKYDCPVLLATTGHSDSFSVMKDVTEKIPVVCAPNTSLMANLMSIFSELSASSLAHFQSSIIDIHHANKNDAPSGTAKTLAKAITDNCPSAVVGIHSIRQGNVVGEHMVYFFNEFERLELTHRVVDRSVFAQGALLAAQFLLNQKPGLYGMKDVLNLNLTIKNKHK